jgi:hypothetical protein
MSSPPDPAALTLDERFRELAHLLAAALLRLAAPIIPANSQSHPPAETLPESPANELAESPQKSVTVHAG